MRSRSGRINGRHAALLGNFVLGSKRKEHVMKKLGMLVCGTMLSLAAFAQDTKTKDKDWSDSKNHASQFCASTKSGSGAMVIKEENSTLKTDKTLPNGSVLFTDGVIKRKDGSYYSLKEGECVNKEGEVLHKDAGLKNTPKKEIPEEATPKHK